MTLKKNVAILILVDFPLQYLQPFCRYCNSSSRNPYFSGFSLAIWRRNRLTTVLQIVAILILVDFPLQCPSNTLYSRLYRVAILILVDFPLQYTDILATLKIILSRNPYFSGFSLAITMAVNDNILLDLVAILILVDFPLQC